MQMKPELRWLKVHLHLVKRGLHLENIIKLFINMRMKPELHWLKVHLHLAKPVLHPNIIITLFINCVDEARAWPAEGPPSSGEAHASSGQCNKLYSPGY